RHPRWGEPVGPLISGHFPEACTTACQPIVQRRLPDTACRLRLPKRPVHRVEQPERLEGPIMEIFPVALERHAAANIDIPQIHGWMSIDDPVGEHLARTSGRLDANRVEAGRNE